MNFFLTRLIFFLIPVIFFFLIPSFFLITSGENLRSIQEITSDRKKEYVVGYKFNESNYKYIKWKSINNSDPLDVLALGSSRVLQFRDSMFTGKFYNGGFTIQTISDFEQFLKGLNIGKLPKIIVIGLDQWMFNSAWDSSEIKHSPEYWSKSFNFFPTVNTIKNVWIEIINKNLPIKRTGNKNIINIGLGAFIDKAGIRNDGSYSYGNYTNSILKNDTISSDFFNNIIKRIIEGNNRFEYGEYFNKRAIKSFIELLVFCQTNNVYVVSFLPPFADTVAQKMSQSGKYEYIVELNQALECLKKHYKFEFYNFGTMNLCNSSDLEAIDGFHGSEVTYTRLLLKMLKENSSLNMYSVSASLSSKLTRPRFRLELYLKKIF
jgi:hypothetical protein